MVPARRPRSGTVTHSWPYKGEPGFRPPESSYFSSSGGGGNGLECDALREQLSAAPADYNAYDDQLKSLRDQSAALDGQVSQTQAAWVQSNQQLGNDQVQLGQLKQKAAAAEGDLKAANDQLAADRDVLSSLQSQWDALDRQVAAIQAQLTPLAADMSRLSADIASLQAQLQDPAVKNDLRFRTRGAQHVGAGASRSSQAVA